ncbi:MAG: hypothetical protein KC587_18025, partial [Nitrospira sp.]|nr:hypothetical protein [Nitrospira sp.]
MFTIHDGSAGIFVRANPSSKEVEWQGDSKVIATLTPGAEIEMEGILEQGSFKPTILAISIRV